jgi:hypothetical protein
MSPCLHAFTKAGEYRSVVRLVSAPIGLADQFETCPKWLPNPDYPFRLVPKSFSQRLLPQF